MTGEDAKIWRRMVRRLKSARASVMFEFAMVAPLVVMVAAFAADFTRILRTEQQLEIAARLGADVEAHMANYYGKEGVDACPSREAKGVAKHYLANIAHVPKDGNTDYLYMKGEVSTVKNPLTDIVSTISNWLDGQGWGDSDNLFLKIVGKILGGLLNFVTFGTLNYITDVVPHDRQVQVTLAAYIPTILPTEGYEWLGLMHGDRDEYAEGKVKYGLIGVGQFDYDLTGGDFATAWDLELDTTRRHRVYCVMPVMDSVPTAPKTYVRIVKGWFKKFLEKFS